MNQILGSDAVVGIDYDTRVWTVCSHFVIASRNNILALAEGVSIIIGYSFHRRTTTT